jgi:hypothetical protein
MLSQCDAWRPSSNAPANASPHVQSTLEGLDYRALGTYRWRLQSAETEIDPISGSSDVGNGTPSPKHANSVKGPAGSRSVIEPPSVRAAVTLQ